MLLRLLILALLLIFTSCATEKTRLKQSEIDQYSSKFFKQISYLTNLKHGELVVKYDLLDIDKISKNNCIFSSSYFQITHPKNLSKEQYQRYLVKLEEKIEFKISSNKWLSIIDDNIDEKIENLHYISLLYKEDKNTKPVSKKKNIFDLTGKNINLKNISIKLNKLAKIDKTAASIPILTPIEKYNITSHFSLRKDPFTKKMKKHSGIDLQAGDKAKIYATAKGIVSFTGVNGGYGNLVTIDHGAGYTTRYAHLNKILVKKGQKLKSLDLIGLQGGTGKTTGDHLHYEVRYKDQPLNPVNFLNAGRICSN